MNKIIPNNYDNYGTYYFSNTKANSSDDEEAPLLVPNTQKKIVDVSQIALQKSLSVAGINQKQKFMQSIKERITKDFLMECYTPIYAEPLLEQLTQLCKSEEYEDFLYLESISEGRNRLIIEKIFRKIVENGKGGSNEKLPNVYEICSTEEIFKVSKAFLGWCQSNRDELSKLSSLDLNAKDLSELPPEIFEFLPNLEEFNLSNNALFSLPTEIKNLKNLKILDVSNNHFKKWPEEISALKSLEVLNLAKNQIPTIPESIAKLKNLKNVDLNENKLSVVSEKIGRLKNLEILVVKDNQLAQVPCEIAKLKKLKILDLSYNYVETIPSEFNKMNLDYYNDNFNSVNSFFKKMHLPSLTFGLSQVEFDESNH